MTPLEKSARRSLDRSWQWGWSLSKRQGLATPALNETRAVWTALSEGILLFCQAWQLWSQNLAEFPT